MPDRLSARAGQRPRIGNPFMAIFYCVLCSPAALLAQAPPPASDAEPADRIEQRFVLFRPATPSSVPAAAQNRLQAAPPGVEVLHSRWVRLTDVDPSGATVGDRVVIEAFAGEAFELEISRVEEDYSRTVLAWAGRFPGRTEIALSVIFSRDSDPKRRPTLFSASLDIPGQWRRIAIETTPDMPGWGLVKEVRPGTAPYLGNDQVGTDFSSPEKPENPQPPEQ